MDVEERVRLITGPPTEEFLVPKELREKLQAGVRLRHYIGYEISGLIHLGQLLTALKIADLQKAGVETSVFMADFHTVINHKLGGDVDFIRKVAKNYFKKAVEAGIKLSGGQPEKTRFVLASDIYDTKYWETVIQVGKATTLSRSLRSITIMGHEEQEGVPTAWVVYPLMQAADIFHQGINIAHAGMDQRKVHMLARDVGMKVAGYKPLALHNHMLLGLHKPPVWPVPKDKEGRWQSFKMSKSVKGSAVFLTDSEEDIRKKAAAAFCPDGADYNPVLDWVKHLAFAPQLGGRFEVRRSEKYGGNTEYMSYASLEKDFLAKKLHPSDLKGALGEFLVELLKPFRKLSGDAIVKDLRNRVTR